MNKAAKVTVYSVVLVFIGFGLGYACANMPFGKDNTKGDVAKVSRFSKNTVSPQASAYQEKILNDSEAMQQAKASLALLGSRMEDFDNLVGFAKKFCQGNEHFATSLADMESISTLSANAKNAAVAASESFDDMVDGKKGAANDFEKASNNLILAYLMVNRQAGIGKTFVNAVDEYLKDRKIEDNIAMATTRDLWAAYLASQAYIDEDKEALSYWADKNALLTDPKMLAALENDMKTLFSNSETDFANIICSFMRIDAMEQIFEDKTVLELFHANEKLNALRQVPDAKDVIGINERLDLIWLGCFRNNKKLKLDAIFNNIDASELNVVWRH